MNFEHKKSLFSLNTFGFSQSAEYFCRPTSEDELAEAMEFAITRHLAIFMLGGGSNLVLTQDLPGLVIQLNNQSIDYQDHPNGCIVTCGAGLNWHQFVLATLSQGWSGLENLSLIPGHCGAAPIQNIGAYGVELADRLHSVRVLDLFSGEYRTLTQKECQFGYRDSIFKQKLKGQVAVIAITLKLDRIPHPVTSYSALAKAIEERELTNPTPQQISDIVCSIRSKKLPDPVTIGNVGSFFKNPVITIQQYQTLGQHHPEMPGYADAPGQMKVPAAWLIERCGWKGYQRGAVGVHTQQALVLTHKGGSTGKHLLALAEDIKQSVADTFAIVLEQEPVTV